MLPTKSLGLFLGHYRRFPAVVFAAVIHRQVAHLEPFQVHRVRVELHRLGELDLIFAVHHRQVAGVAIAGEDVNDASRGGLIGEIEVINHLGRLRKIVVRLLELPENLGVGGVFRHFHVGDARSV